MKHKALLVNSLFATYEIVIEDRGGMEIMTKQDSLRTNDKSNHNI